MSRDDELRVFLREIKDRPEEDTSRLVLADWLQDQGDPRGEFIYLQVTRARLPEDDPRQDELYRRERQILRQHGLEWLGPLADFASAWNFDRGFIHLNVRADQLTDIPDLRGRPEICWLESMKVQYRYSHRPMILVETGLLHELTWLDLSDSWGVSYQPLFHTAASGLRALILRNTTPRPGDESVSRLAATPHLSGLKQLDLSGNRLHDDSAVALAESEYLCGLERLDVSGNRFTEVGRQALRESFGERVVFQRGWG
jgi:uncharacterized protein (TIGR02996 family)